MKQTRFTEAQIWSLHQTRGDSGSASSLSTWTSLKRVSSMSPRAVPWKRLHGLQNKLSQFAKTSE
jgi:hypothetical protein